MKTAAVILLAAVLTACASHPAKPKTAAELACDYEAQRSMAGQMGANPFEAVALYRSCMAAKKAGAL